MRALGVVLSPSMKLHWSYTPSPVDQCAAERWVCSNDCSVIDMVLIGEDSLAASAVVDHGMKRPIVTVKRHIDLGTDLATALIDLRLHLPPPAGARVLTSF
jgi:hypothetical protein